MVKSEDMRYWNVPVPKSLDEALAAPPLALESLVYSELNGSGFGFVKLLVNW